MEQLIQIPVFVAIIIAIVFVISVIMLIRQINKLKKEKGEANIMISESVFEKEKLRLNVDSLEKEKDDLKKSLNENYKTIEELRKSQNVYLTKSKNLENDITKLSEMLLDKQHIVKKQEKDINLCKSTIKDLEFKKEEDRKLLINRNEHIDSLKNQITELNNQTTELNNIIDSLRIEMKVLEEKNVVEPVKKRTRSKK